MSNGGRDGLSFVAMWAGWGLQGWGWEKWEQGWSLGLGLVVVSSGSRVGSFYLLWASLLAPALPGCATWPSLSEKRLGAFESLVCRRRPCACHLHPPSLVLKAGRHCALLAFLVLLFSVSISRFHCFWSLQSGREFSEIWKMESDCIFFFFNFPQGTFSTLLGEWQVLGQRSLLWRPPNYFVLWL